VDNGIKDRFVQPVTQQWRQIL